MNFSFLSCNPIDVPCLDNLHASKKLVHLFPFPDVMNQHYNHWLCWILEQSYVLSITCLLGPSSVWIFFDVCTTDGFHLFLF